MDKKEAQLRKVSTLCERQDETGQI